jgi:hypothetical protein
MDIVNISQSDDLATVARKCDTNFKQVSWSLRQYVNKQGRIAGDQVDRAITVIRDEVDGLVAGLPGMVSNEVTTQLNAMDLPTIIEEEVESQMQGIYPPLGSYLLTNYDPSNDYPGTYWQQVDSVTTDGNVTIPLWQRTVI